VTASKESLQDSGWQSAIPYVGPMAAFMAMLWLGPRLGLGEWEFPFRVVVLSAILWLCSRHVITLRASYWLASTAVGVVVFAIWVAPDLLIPGWRSHWLFQNSITGSVATSIDTTLLTSPMVLIFRTIRAVILVPIIEELFWRGWLMRWLIKPEFEKVPLGTYSAQAFWITVALFAAEHGSYWEVGALAGIAYNWWMVRTRSLGDCILAHAVTNAVLSAYVLMTGNWQYW
jgi:CAAX prenyl protease-like protein